jgi:hypothetical protein
MYDINENISMVPGNATIEEELYDAQVWNV